MELSVALYSKAKESGAGGEEPGEMLIICRKS